MSSWPGTPFTATAGSVFTATQWNTYGRDTQTWLHDVMLGGDPSLIASTDSPYAQGSEDGLIVADTSGGNIQVDLDPVVSARPVMLKKVSASNSLAIEPDGADTIDGAPNLVLTDDDAFALLVPDGAEWHVVASTPVTDHGALSGLADDDHTQYVRADGTRAITGGQKFGSYVDLDEIAAPANPAANVARIYSKDVGGVTKVFFRDSAGTETEIGGGMKVKSMQRGSITIAAGSNSSATATITAVVMAQSRCRFNGSTGADSSSGSRGRTGAALTATTTVTAYRQSDGNQAATTTYFEVEETEQ